MVKETLTQVCVQICVADQTEQGFALHLEQAFNTYCTGIPCYRKEKDSNNSFNLVK